MNKIFVILMSVTVVSLNSFAQANSGAGQWMRLTNPDKIECGIDDWRARWVQVRYQNDPIFTKTIEQASSAESLPQQYQSCKQAKKQAQIDGNKSVYMNTETGLMVPEDGYFVRSR